ncbi:uncharacterized protein LOC135495796 [Lineus longissimus]|uniref:uncharacterized protein LOC135495796 n=1 Tax=Lineus longissimus TaxID=88925 RepID=UPI002B4E3B1D
MQIGVIAILAVVGCSVRVTDSASTVYGYVGANVYCYQSSALLRYISNQRYAYQCAAFCNSYSTCQSYFHHYSYRRCYLYKIKCPTTIFRYWGYWYYEYQEKASLSYLHRPENLAFKKTTKISSVASTSYGSARAVDGNRESNEVRFSCAVSFLKKTNPHWWYVDLGKTYDVGSIFYLNGMTYYQAANTKIYVTATVAQTGDKLAWTNGTECGSIGSTKLDVSKGGSKWFHCPEPAHGRYVIFYKKPADYYLTLCEVEVYRRNIIHNDVSCEKSADMYGALQTNMEPSRCVDGWGSQYFENGAVFRSVLKDPGIYKWWMVDLATTFQIRKVSLSSVMYFSVIDKQYLLGYTTVYTSNKFTKNEVTLPSGMKGIDMDGYKECAGIGQPALKPGEHISLFCPDKQLARFVIIIKAYASMKSLAISNVEVLGHAPNGDNLALFKQAMQVDNTALGNSVSAKAVDGAIAPQSFAAKKCISTTGTAAKDWWTVDLLKVYRIHQVILTTLQDKPLSDLKIVSSVDFDPAAIDSKSYLPCYESPAGWSIPAGMSWQTKCKPNYGRYVTVMGTKKGPLYFCEFEVYGAKHDANLAYAGPSKQSSTYWHYDPILAVDGDASPDFSKKTCSQTLKTQTGPKWWSVDLRATYRISRLKISNVKSCGSNCLRKFKILVTDSFNSASYSSNTFQTCFDYTGTMVSPSVESLTCTSAVNGRFVIIETSDTSYALTICEVEIYTALIWPNIALKKTASQSSNQAGTGGRAGLAVDGWRNPNYDEGSCAMTGGKDSYEWIGVDLAASYIIRKVTVTNRNKWASLMKDVYVSVVEKFDSSKFASNYFKTCAVIKSMTSGETRSMHCESALVGQHVVLRKNNFYKNSPLSVCELSVYGSPYRENLALKKKAYQSNAMFAQSKPSMAVDGVLSPDYHLGKRCSSTAGKLATEWWAVDLVKTYTVSGMVMMASAKCPSCGFDAHKGLDGVEGRITRELFTNDVFRTSYLPCFKNDKTLYPGEAVKATCIGGARGRFVLFLKSPAQNKPLVLCEVEVFGKIYTYNKTNLLLNKIAKVSTEGSGRADSSQGANDGVPNPKIAGGSCAQTKGVNPYEWWMVDMDDYYNIKRVIIANSADSGDDNLVGVDILLTMDFNQEDLNIRYPGAYFAPSSTSGSSPSSGGSNTTSNSSTVTTTNAPAGGSWTFETCAQLNKTVAPGQYVDITCTNNVTGRFMIIIKNNTVNNTLVLCEVEAFGNWVYVPTTAPPPTASTSESPSPSPPPTPAPVKTTKKPVTEPEPEPSGAGAIVGAVVGILACSGAGVGCFFGYKQFMAKKAATPVARKISVKEASEPSEADDTSETDRRPASVSSILTTVNHE